MKNLVTGYLLRFFDGRQQLVPTSDDILAAEEEDNFAKVQREVLSTLQI